MNHNDTRRGWFYIAVAVVLASLTFCLGWSVTKSPQVFDPAGCLSNSALIARGWLDKDGKFASVEVFRGAEPTPVITIGSSAIIYQRLQASMNASSKEPTNTIEVVAFLAARGCSYETNVYWQPVLGCGGIVGLQNTNVYLFRPGDGSQGYECGWPISIVRRDEHFSRETFLAWIQEHNNH